LQSPPSMAQFLSPTPSLTRYATRSRSQS
jgi:hypothetical protein